MGERSGRISTSRVRCAPRRACRRFTPPHPGRRDRSPCNRKRQAGYGWHDARAHLADPHIALKVAEGREAEIRPCVGMGYCIDSIYSGQAVCIHNAATGREETIPHIVPRSPGPKRKVVVVGAGPAGLEAARVAGERGHEVVVLEAASKPGGQIVLAAALKRRREILGIVDWRVSECERLGVGFSYNAFAEAGDVLEQAPDVVVIATGGAPNVEFLDSGGELATTSWDLLSGAARPSGEVIVYDDNGAHPGLTAAEFVAELGAKLEIVTPERTLAPDVGGTAFHPTSAPSAAPTRK